MEKKELKNEKLEKVTGGQDTTSTFDNGIPRETTVTTTVTTTETNDGAGIGGGKRCVTDTDNTTTDFRTW